LQL
jgi:hypothetical protein